MNLKCLAAVVLASAFSAAAQAHYTTPLSLVGVATESLDPVTGIVLEGGAGQNVTFSGQGAGTTGVNVTFGSCSAGSCTLTGTASGSGGLLSTAAFSLTSAPDAIALTPTAVPGVFDANGSAQLSLTGTANGVSGTLLSGVLNLVNFAQQGLSSSGSASVIGTFNQNVNGNVGSNLTITGGLLAHLFTAAGGVVQLNVQLPSPAAIAVLEGTNASLSASMISTSLTPTPEPAPLVLLALGILVLAVLRRRAVARQATSRRSLPQLG